MKVFEEVTLLAISELVGLLTDDLILHTRFLFEDFKTVLFELVDLVEGTLFLEIFGLKIVPSDFAIKTDETL